MSTVSEASCVSVTLYVLAHHLHKPPQTVGVTIIIINGCFILFYKQIILLYSERLHCRITGIPKQGLLI